MDAGEHCLVHWSYTILFRHGYLRHVPVLAEHAVAVRRRRRREGEAVELAAALDGELAGAAFPRTGEAAAAGGREEEE
jgi:hypothetical protein